MFPWTYWARASVIVKDSRVQRDRAVDLYITYEFSAEKPLAGAYVGRWLLGYSRLCTGPMDVIGSACRFDVDNGYAGF